MEDNENTNYLSTPTELYYIDLGSGVKSNLFHIMKKRGVKPPKGYRVNGSRRKYFTYDGLKLIYDTINNREKKYLYTCIIDAKLKQIKLLLDNPDEYVIKITNNHLVTSYRK